jgi:hypothetical protein
MTCLVMTHTKHVIALNLSTLQVNVMLAGKISLIEILLLEAIMFIANSVILVVADE